MLRDLLNMLYPETCLGCDKMLQTGESILCTVCRHELPLTSHHINNQNDAFKRLMGRFPLEQVVSMLVFEKDGIVQRLIHHLKYEGHQHIGGFLGNWYGEVIKEKLHDINQIIPVPLHKRRLKERGYNQVTTFCKALSEVLQIPMNEQLLFRKQYTKTQTKNTFFTRTKLKQEVFDVNFSEKDSNQHYLLVDDVLTTGTTLEQCSKALLKIPNAKISIVTMALTY